MLKHYFKIAARNFWKHKAFSVLNISGLAIGMAAAMVLALWISNQLSVDSFHEKKENIFKVYTNKKEAAQVQTYSSIAAPVALALRSDFSGVKQVCRIGEKNGPVHYEDKVLNANGNIVDPAFLDMFNFPLLSGTTKSLETAKAIFISEKLALAFFGNESPLGKIIGIDSTQSFFVKGVFKDLPDNTQFKFDYLLAWQSLPTTDQPDNTSWKNGITTFVELQPGTAIGSLNKKVTDYALANNPESNAEAGIFFYPLSKTWLYARFENGKPAGGIIDMIRILAIICFVIVLIACINFMNLSTARSLQRSKEVGVRKVIGGKRISLVWQFIGESVFLAFIAGLLALAIVVAVLPSFNLLTGKHIIIPYGSVYFWLIFLAFILITGILAGSYPAWFLSSFNTLHALKGILAKKNNFVTPGKILFVFQFTIAIILINFTMLIQRQVNHLKTREVGFTSEKLVFHTLTPSLLKNYAVVKNELSGLRSVDAIAVSNAPITRSGMRNADIEWNGINMTDKPEFDIRSTTGNYIKTNGLTLLMGRDIDMAQFPSDSNACIINETAVKAMRSDNPIGQQISQGNSPLTVVGVVKDFITTSALQRIDPVIIRGSANNSYISIRLNRDAALSQTVPEISAVLKKYNENFVTELQYADDDYDQKTRGLRLTAILTNIFTFIAIFISCLGLFGLVMYVTESKAKEVSIRKVFGAGILQLTTMLSKSFISLVIVAFLIASPLAWLLMSAFLRPLYYRTPLSMLLLFEAGVIALVITAATICSQTVKIGMANPVKHLRTE